ncbi:MAG: ATP-dependent DNA helicase [Burkholderiaceae bacterium]
MSSTASERGAVLADIFSATGALATRVHGYRPREGQLEMAEAVAAAIDACGTLIAEAGTGTGKTFAYLVPALLWGGKVIISTGTKTLQDQLFRKDVPMVRAALQAPVTVALLKGRSNYVCHEYLKRTQENGRLTSRQDAVHLRSIVRFAQSTGSGDRAELAEVPELAPIWNLVTSTRDNCLGSECTHYRECFVMKARRAAQEADVVVVNHHLFFADLVLRDEGITDLLPTANTVVFDEAHQLPETATLFFGETVSTAQLLELARDVLAEGHTHARDAARWVEEIAPLEKAARDLRLSLGIDTQRLNFNQLPASAPFHAALADVHRVLLALAVTLEHQAERAETIEQCWRRALQLAERIARWQIGDSEVVAPTIRWLEAFTHTLQMHRTPLSVAEVFNRERDGSPRAWIFTSATLAVKNDFDHFTAQLGLSSADAKSWPSPFDYAKQGLLYLPEGLPDPMSPRYTASVVDAAWPLIRAAGGRTFVLCTTLRAVRTAGDLLRERLKEEGLDFPLLQQGEGSRSELLERFRRAGNAVLVGSQSFWEGIDVRGKALSLVVIDKLPFAPPDDPVLAARLDALAKRGGNPFMDYQLPTAVISLKQGAGRLIRDETDRGVLMICDPRLVTKPYGRRIWQSLPPFRRTRDEAVATAFFDEAEIRLSDDGEDDARLVMPVEATDRLPLTRASTTDSFP